MPTPTKPISVILSEGNKRCLTKAEIKHRKEQEENLTTGLCFEVWEDVKKNKVAYKEFKRLKKVFSAIGKDDALHESSINRYCLMHSECKDLSLKINDLEKELLKLEENEDDFDSYKDFIKQKNSLITTISRLDNKLMAKRKSMLDIEKENIMTIASSLRTIPKKPESTKKETKMSKFLKQRGVGHE